MSISASSQQAALPLPMQQSIRDELERDEQLVWCGRQSTMRRNLLMSLPLAIFGLVFTAFSCFWIGMALFIGGKAGGGPAFFRYIFPLFGLPFLLVGLAMLTSPYWLARRARGSFYALTNKRAIVWRAGFFGGTQVRSFRSEDIEDLSRNEYGNDQGDLIFQEYTTVSYSHSQTGHGRMRHYRHQLGFLGIDGVRDVERMLREHLLNE